MYNAELKNPKIQRLIPLLNGKIEVHQTEQGTGNFDEVLGKIKEHDLDMSSELWVPRSGFMRCKF